MPAGRKRKAAPAAPEVAVSTPPASSSSRRRSQRVSTSATQTSKYFEPEDSESESDVKPRRKSLGSSKKANASKSPRASKKAKLEADDEDDYEDDEAPDNEEKEEESELDEDALPKTTFIPLPKLRDTGGIDYADDRLHPNTLAFLKDLKANNKRSWLKSEWGFCIYLATHLPISLRSSNHHLIPSQVSQHFHIQVTNEPVKKLMTKNSGAP